MKNIHGIVSQPNLLEKSSLANKQKAQQIKSTAAIMTAPMVS